MLFVIGLWTFLRALLSGSAAIALENLALRHQLAVLQRSVRRPRLSRWDRVLWVWLSRVWVGWRASLVIVQPATVLAWHRQGFQLYWRWRSTANRVAGRSSTPKFAASSDAWRGRIRPEAGGPFRRSSPCSATKSPSSPSPRCAPGQPPAPENLTGKCSQRGFIGHRAALHSVTPYGKRS